MSTYRKILLTQEEDAVRESLKAGESGIYPGHIIKESAAGTCVRDTSDGGTVLPMIALENNLAGKTVTDAYTSGHQVQAAVPVRGSIGVLILSDGETATFGSLLESNGASKPGEVRVVDTDPSLGTVHVQSVIAKALESASPSGATAQIKVRFL